MSAGGKGVNVSRSLTQLGTASRVIGLSAGRVGKLIECLARSDDIDISAVTVPGESRIVSILIGGDPPRSLVVNPPGPNVAADDWRRLVQHVVEQIHDSRPDAVICTGSLPPGIPPDGYNDILLAAEASSAMTAIDASGDVLRAALGTDPCLAKVNLKEALSVLDADHPSDLAIAAESLRHAGAVVAIVTGGLQGASAASRNEVLLGEVPSVTARGTTGAGDAFLAGFLASHLSGGSLTDALTDALATASASVETITPGEFDFERRNSLRRASRLRYVRGG